MSQQFTPIIHRQPHSPVPSASPVANRSHVPSATAPRPQSGVNPKKPLIIGIIIGILILGGIIFAVIKLNSKSAPAPVAETPAPKKKKISVPSNIIPFTERPFLTLEPVQGKNGRSLKITLQTLPRTATTAEYLLEYEVGGAQAQNSSGKNIAVPETENPVGLQGSMGEMDPTQLPATSELLLGTCSAGGACVLNTGLGEGTLTVTLGGGEENYAVASSFFYVENKDGATSFATADKNFTMQNPDLKKVKDVVIMQSSGLPAGLDLTPVTIPGAKEGSTLIQAYQVAFLGDVPTGEYKVSIADQSGNPTFTKKVMAYSAKTKTWSELTATATGDTYDVTAPLADIYALVVAP